MDKYVEIMSVHIRQRCVKFISEENVSVTGVH